MAKSPASILVAGAINTDLVATMKRAPAAGETITGSGFAIHGGGKAANQAVAVARSGGIAHLVGSIGDDDFGASRSADLARDGVRTDWVRTNPEAASGVAMILVEEDGENRIAYIPGATRTVSVEHVRNAFEAIRPRFVLVPNELPIECLRELFERATRAGASIVLNATPDPLLIRELLSYVTVLVVNEGEAAELLEGNAPGDAPSAVRRLRATGLDTVVLTAGGEGAYVCDSEGVTHHPAPSVDVVDTTGAGDTFCGAFVAELAAGASMADAVSYGVKASALSVTRPGAQSSIPTRAELEAI